MRFLCSQRCVESYLFWINTFGMTFRPKVAMADGREVALSGRETIWPFVLWPCQDDLAAAAISSIWGGRSLVVDKSRDMGASWVLLSVFQWMFQFFPNMSFLEMSREERAVYDPGDMSALFSKHSFLMEYQPKGMVPPHESTALKFARTDCRSSIVGTATGENKGRAGRYSAVLLDEAAFIRQLRPLWVSMEQTVPCRIANSTAFGPGYFSKLVRSGKYGVVRLPWWDHPEKGVGAYETVNPETGAKTITSPYLERKRDEAIDARDVAQEFEMDHDAATSAVFDLPTITRQLSTYARPPVFSGYLTVDGHEDHELSRMVGTGRCPSLRFTAAPLASGYDSLHLWCDLVKDRDGVFRPPQSRNYVIGSDVGLGLGASNTTASVIDTSTGDKVAEFASAKHGPEDWARKLAALGFWFGGPAGCAYLIWESNGAGQNVWKILHMLRYPWYYRSVDESKVSAKVSDSPGFHQTNERKKALILNLAGAMRRDEFRNPSKRAIEEASTYSWYDSGDVGTGERADLTTGARSQHGDLTIADALALHGSIFWVRSRPPVREPDEGTFLEFKKRIEEKARRDNPFGPYNPERFTA